MRLTFLLLTWLFSVISGGAQSLVGNWVATVATGFGNTTAVLHFGVSRNALASYFINPDWGIRGDAADAMSIAKDNIFIEYNPRLSFRGWMLNDSVIKGVLSFGDKGYAASFKKTATLPDFRKPQTPVPPYPYASRLLSFYDSFSKIRYGGTITWPRNDSPPKRYPAVILLSGSEPNRRDYSFGAHKPFVVIADYLTRAGYVVMRTDDRGVGLTGGQFATATLPDFANDAGAALRFLKSQPMVDSNAIGLLGHSEGAMVAPMAAVQNPGVKFIILMAPPVLPFKELLLQQYSDVFSSDLGPAVSERFIKLFQEELALLPHVKDTSKFLEDFKEKLSNLRDQKGNRLMNPSKDSVFMHQFIQSIRERWLSPRMQYLYHFKPAEYLSKLKIPVLGLFAEKDLQVNTAQNRPALETALQQSHHPLHRVLYFKGLNHGFQHCISCKLEENVYLEETISPEVLAGILRWLNDVQKDSL